MAFFEITFETNFFFIHITILANQKFLKIIIIILKLGFNTMLIFQIINMHVLTNTDDTLYTHQQ